MNQKKAEADLAYDLQKFKTGQFVKAEEVQVSIIEKQKQIELQQQEILRKQRELEANVQKPADAERYRVETLANAQEVPIGNRSRRRGLRDQGHGLCRRRRRQGHRSGRGRRQQGARSGRGRHHRGARQGDRRGDELKAESFKQYNEAAVIEMIVRILPEVAGKISEPLSKTEKIVIINSGSGPGGGASKLTGDVTQIISQLPPVIESLTGIKFEKLLEQVPALKKAMEEG